MKVAEVRKLIGQKVSVQKRYSAIPRHALPVPIPISEEI